MPMFDIPQAKNKSVDVHNFAMIPKADIPRSSFDVEHDHKTTFNSGYLVPIYEDELLPGDSISLSMTAFCRLATPIVPVMDNVHLETFFFFVPLRLIWTNFVKMMGQQDNPADSISFSTPQVTSPVGGWTVGSLQDYLGLPTVGQVGGGATITHANLWPRAYNLIYNEWFRDENLQNSVTVDKGDGPDTAANYVLLRRGKRKDYFTGALPWPQKGATAVSLPLGTSADVKYKTTAHQSALVRRASDNALMTSQTGFTTDGGGGFAPTPATALSFFDPNGSLYADLSTATAATINQLRLAFQTQKVLERDARGGTRYTEIIRSHFGVVSPDARLQRPEYLGGGSSPIVTAPIPQTSQTGLTGGSTPIGTLAATWAAHVNGHGFTYSATEHGVLLGLVQVRADLSYQQGLRRMWRRLTRYDYYLPAFAMLGEQTILNEEIYADGSGNDSGAFGYQERWAEYRYHPSKITGLFRSTSAGTIDIWHLSQKFNTLPTLATTFIQDTPPLQRVMAVGAGAAGQEIFGDFFFKQRMTRPMPMYSVPGMIDHF